MKSSAFTKPTGHGRQPKGRYPEGSFELTKIGSTIYLNPDEQFRESNGGAAASTIINLVNGKYIKISSTGKNMGSVSCVADASGYLLLDSTSRWMTS